MNSPEERAKTLENIVSRLQNEETRWDAILQLKVIKDHTWVDDLVKLLSHDDWVIRWCVAEKLGELGHTRAIHPLIALLSDRDFHVRKNATKALIRFGSKMVPVITRYFSADNPIIRNQVAQILLNVGPKIIPDLEVALEDEGWVVSNRIIDIIWRLGTEAAEPAIIRAISNPHAQEHAIIVLGMMKSKRAIPHLMKVFNKPNLKRLVVYSLFRIGEEEAYPVIVNALLSNSSNITTLTTQIIQKIGIPILKHLAKAVPNAGTKRKMILALMLKIDETNAMPYIQKLIAAYPDLTHIYTQLTRHHHPDSNKGSFLSKLGF
jgi:HEAT repeat protein